MLCVDEKSQIQALDRSAPGLAVAPGQPERRTHDYVRHGTTTLFAALDVKTGTVIGECHAAPSRRSSFARFLDTIDAAVPPELDVHLILDNYATHKTAAIRRWLAKRPRYHVHFTPTSASWLNLVERWFVELTEKQIRRGVHRSTRELVTTIQRYLGVTNETPGHSCGIKRLTRFWRASPGSASELLTRGEPLAPVLPCPASTTPPR